METKLNEAMTSGVFVEFRDAQGASAGQAVYLDSRGKPVPGVGDLLCCEAANVSGRRRKLAGRVASRQFEVQLDEQGESCVWVRLVVYVAGAERNSAGAAQAGPYRIEFSNN